MCGIVGYIGGRQAAPILLDGLKKLEYRGYDSAGLAVLKPDGESEVVKCKGRISALCKMTQNGKKPTGTCGIGHTRWATHGEPSYLNAHPHFSDDKSVIAVHNGIIENYRELKEKLLKSGYTFYSETDTEVAAKLVDYYYKNWKNPIEALISFSLRACGSFALAVMFSDYPRKIYVARKDSPLVIGLCGDESFIASDVPAILEHSRDVYYMGNGEVACVGDGCAEFYDIDKKPINKQVTHIDWDVNAAERGGYAHFMLKEINEQPQVVAKTLGSCMRGDVIDFSRYGITEELLSGINNIRFIGCGSAYHVGAAAARAAEEIARIPSSSFIASEFRYMNPVYTGGDLAVFISQSGETADTLAALRSAKQSGVFTLAIVNVLGSAIAREADAVIYTSAGPEIAVATTKAYSSQLVVCYLLIVKLAYLRGAIDEKRYNALKVKLFALPAQIEGVIKNDKEIKRIASLISGRKDAYFIGRGTDFAACLEGSLKLKEVSYIHSDAYPAGELKHGTISLVEKDTLVFGVVTDEKLSQKTANNLQEVKSRGAFVVTVACEGDKNVSRISDVTLYVPRTEPCFSASLSVVVMQLVSYYVSVCKGLDVDKPRNLAKCVSVE